MSDSDMRGSPASHPSRGDDGDERTRQVKEFYERYHFPGIRPLEQDGLILNRRMMQKAAERTSVGRDEPMRVLDGGCGTGNTLISLARHIPEATFLGLDISRPSLGIASEAASAADLGNISFREHNLLHPIAEEALFDVVLCLGVLHHTVDMDKVLSNLGRACDDEGELYLWVYGKHGRYHHQLNHRLLQMLIESGPEPVDPVELARDFIEHAGGGMALRDLQAAIDRMASNVAVLDEPAWVADQFIHPLERLLEMEDLLTLVSNAGLQIVEWLGVDQVIESYFSSSRLIDRFLHLAPDERLVALDLLLKPDRYFVRLQKSVNGDRLA
ncbi:class I SAM-dependent methyltransferase [Gemmatimonadota bacterium]